MSMDNGSFGRFPGNVIIGPRARTPKRLWKAQVIAGFLVAVPACLLESSLVWVGYSSMCSSYASDLESAAAKYNQAKFLCGPSGHLRQEYRNAAQEVEDATKLIKSAMSDVASSCVIANEEQESARTNAELKKTASPFENDVRR